MITSGYPFSFSCKENICEKKPKRKIKKDTWLKVQETVL